MLCAQPAAESGLHDDQPRSYCICHTICPELPAWHLTSPVGPRTSIVISAWWLLREIELSALKLADVSIETDKVSLTLPASKTDPEAVGVERAHVCACGTLRGAAEVTDEVCCPPCTVLRQKATVRALFPQCSKDWPLLPTSTGQFVSKALMVQTIITAVSLLELTSHTHSKNR